MSRKFLSQIVACLALLGAAGCATIPPPGPVANPLFIPFGQERVVWETVVEVIHAHNFEIARESNLGGSLGGTIETEYQVGSGVLEPWHHDSVGAENRLEATLQSIRRRAIVNLAPAEGGYIVNVQVFKELEDVPGPTAISPGTATFQEASPLQRDLGLVLGSAAPSGWIPQGRDLPLEQQMLASLREAFLR